MMTEILKLTTKELKKHNFRVWHADNGQGAHECHNTAAADDRSLFYFPDKLGGGNSELFLETGSKI
jgi:hypothetical protein